MGWAWTAAPKIAIVSGCVNFSNKQYEGGGMRYLKFRRWLGSLPQPTEIYFEEVKQRPLSVAAGHVYGGFLATLTGWCEEKEIPYAGVPVGTIKKFATGKGNAGKREMIVAAMKDGLDTLDDNEADAYWLLKYSLEQQNIRV